MPTAREAIRQRNAAMIAGFGDLREKITGAVETAGEGQLAQARAQQEVPGLLAEQAPDLARGAVSGALGAPVDIATMLAKGQARAEGLEDPFPPLAQLREVPGSTDFLIEQLGGDPGSAGSIGGQFLPLPTPGKVAALGKGIGLAAAGIAPIRSGAKARKFADDIPLETSIPEDLERVNFTRNVQPEVVADKRIKTTGKYRGAPREINSPQRLGKLRLNVKHFLEEGILGRAWYDRSSAAFRDLTGNRPGVRERATSTAAVLSQGTGIEANANFAFKGFNQGLVGDPVTAGRFPATQGKKIEQIFSGNPPDLGPKVDPFNEALNVGVEGGVSRPTNDIIMARAFGYKDLDGAPWTGGLGTAQHRFIDREINQLTDFANEKKLGGFDDWTPERVQAAIWVGKRAEDLKKKPKWRNRPAEARRREAATDFATMMDSLTANILTEAQPAPGLGHLPVLETNPEIASEFARAQNTLLTNPEGQSLLALQSGALTRPNVLGPGFFQGQSNPATAVPVLGGTAKGSQAIDPSTEKLVRSIAGAEGLVRGQESVGFTFFRSNVKASERNAARVVLDQPLSQNEMVKLGNKLDEKFDGAIIPTHNGQGVDLLVIDDVPDDWQKEIRKLVQDEFGVKPQLGQNTGDLVGSFEEFAPSKFIPEIEGAGPEVAGRLERGLKELAPKLEALDAQLASSVPDGGQRSEIIRMVRTALSRDGIEGVKRLVDQGLVPVLVLSALGLGGQSLRPEAGQPEA
jgi:hypothetical protein